PVCRARALEMLPQPWALRDPPTDSDVDVVALRKYPRVAARHGGQVDHRAAPPALLARVNIRDVPLEGDTVAPIGESERPRREPVDPVRSDHDRGAGRGSVEADDRLVFAGLESRPAQAVPKVRSRRRGLLGKVSVEPPPLCHQHERLAPAPLEPRPVPEAELEPVDDL